MAASKRLMNFSSVGFTPAGGSLTVITGVQSIALDPNVEVLKASGDSDYYNSFAVAVSEDPQVTITSNQAALLDGVVEGAIGALTFTLNDARSGAGVAGGAKIYAISNVIYRGASRNAQHRQLTTVSYGFDMFSADGITSPIAITAA